MLHQLILHLLDQVCAAIAQLGQAANRVDDQVKAVDVVEHAHVEGGGDGALLLIAPDVEVLVVAAIGQLMDQGGIAVIGDDDGLILGEQRVIIGIGTACTCWPVVSQMLEQ